MNNRSLPPCQRLFFCCFLCCLVFFGMQGHHPTLCRTRAVVVNSSMEQHIWVGCFFCTASNLWLEITSDPLPARQADMPCPCVVPMLVAYGGGEEQERPSSGRDHRREACTGQLPTALCTSSHHGPDSHAPCCSHSHRQTWRTTRRYPRLCW